MVNPLYTALFAPLAARDDVLMQLADGGAITGRGFHALIGQAANALLAAGVMPGDRVAVQVGKSPQALAVYAAGYFLMFGFSLAYNMTPPSALKWLLRRFDHSAIYVMIAGTYTAIVVQFDQPLWAWALGITVWFGAVLGVVVKVVLPGRYDRLSVVAYIALGWVGVLAIGPASASLPAVSLGLIVAGGLTYVAGVAFYKWHALRFHNAIWHLFVAIAAGLHFAAVALAVAQ